MKVLILVNHATTLYLYRKELVEAMIKKGYEIFISSPYEEQLDEFVKQGCNIIDTHIDRRGTNPKNDIKLFKTYLSILSKIKPDIVLTYTVKPNLYGGIACRIKGVKYIPNVTGLGSGFINGGVTQFIIKKLSKLSFSGAYKVMVQNSDNLDILLKNNMINDNYMLIPGSGVNLEKYKLLQYPKKQESIEFNFIGRIIDDKGINEYLKAAKFITQKYSNIIFNVIGIIEDKKYEGIIKQYEQDGYIKYHGFITDITPFIRRACCTINPSYSEGMSNVLLESAACGRPVIASNIPGCKEIIEEDKNGYTFETKNVEELCYKIEKFINLRYEQKVNMGIAGRKIVEKQFDRNIVVNAYIEEINKIDNKKIREVSI